MRERLIESWLAKANERLFQLPFAHALAHKGHTILHVSRHCAMEQGKDLIAVAPDGAICAYQLKGAPSGKIGLKQWRDEINTQVFDLVTQGVNHPSLHKSVPHRSYFVTNGQIEEEVTAAIGALNQQWRDSGNPKFNLQTIVRGQMLADLNELGAAFWPTEPKSLSTFLEMFLQDGRAMLPKGKLSTIIEETFADVLGSGAVEPGEKACGRAIAGMALICSLATSTFREQKNHLAEVETWTIYCSYVLAIAERWTVPERLWKPEFDLGQQWVHAAVADLFEEVRGRANFFEGVHMSDSAVIGPRMTVLVGLLSVYGMRRRATPDETDDDIDRVRDLLLRNLGRARFWGESACPYFLATYWFARRSATWAQSEQLLRTLAEVMATLQADEDENRNLPNPYYGPAEVLQRQLGLNDAPLEDSFWERSFYLEPVFHLIVRENWKQMAKALWPDVSRIGAVHFEPKESWQFYRWRNTSAGRWVVRFPAPREEWADLRRKALDSNGRSLPKLLKRDPLFALILLMVYPHRVSPDLVRWLDHALP